MSAVAAVITRPGAPVEIRRLPVPALEPGAVRLRTVAAEVCGMDVHLWHGRQASLPAGRGAAGPTSSAITRPRKRMDRIRGVLRHAFPRGVPASPRN